LFAYLDENGATLTPEMIDSDDFLHRFNITVRAARRTHSREKIRRFALLLTAPIGEGPDGVKDVDEHGELLGIVEELSEREMLILKVLDRFQEPGSWGTAKWEDRKRQIVEEVGPPSDEIDGVLIRLMRTGLYSENVHTL
jgi:hypothetical protein